MKEINIVYNFFFFLQKTMTEQWSKGIYDFPMMGYDFARPMGIWFPNKKHIWFYYGIWFCLENFLWTELISRWEMI